VKHDLEATENGVERLRARQIAAGVKTAAEAIPSLELRSGVTNAANNKRKWKKKKNCPQICGP
jgi:hypothetical protein